MLLARISNLRSLCCIFQSLSMKRTIIANASPSLVFHQRSQKKHCWQLFLISQSLSPSDESWEWILLDESEMLSDDHIFQQMVANCWLLKGEYLPSVELPQAHIDRASCFQLMWILLLLRLFLQDPWHFDLLAFLNILQRFDVLYGWYVFLDRTIFFGKSFSAGVTS